MLRSRIFHLSPPQKNRDFAPNYHPSEKARQAQPRPGEIPRIWPLGGLNLGFFCLIFAVKTRRVRWNRCRGKRSLPGRGVGGDGAEFEEKSCGKRQKNTEIIPGFAQGKFASTRTTETPLKTG